MGMLHWGSARPTVGSQVSCIDSAVSYYSLKIYARQKGRKLGISKNDTSDQRKEPGLMKTAATFTRPQTEYAGFTAVRTKHNNLPAATLSMSYTQSKQQV